MYLAQVSHDVIYFGTDEHRHTLSIKRGAHFKAADVEAAASDLLTLYPDEAERIERYSAKLMSMLA